MMSLAALLTTSMLVLSISEVAIMSTMRPVEAKGQDPDFYYSVKYYNKYNCGAGVCSSAVGEARFYPYGEHLWACDLSPDGAHVSASASWNGGFGIVGDNGGYFSACDKLNLSIKEGKSVELCVNWWANGGPYEKCKYVTA